MSLPGPDHGLYDGMNRGVAAAMGEIVGILNADDAYTDDREIENMAAAFSDPAVVCVYGDPEYVAAEYLYWVVLRWRS